MDSRSSRLDRMAGPQRAAGFTMLPFLVVVLTLVLASTADAQTTTTSSGYTGITPISGTPTTIPTTPSSGTSTTGQTTTGSTTTGGTTTGGTTTGDPFSDFEQMLLTALQKELAQRFPDADPTEVNFLADLLFGFFMENLFYHQLQQMNNWNDQR